MEGAIEQVHGNYDCHSLLGYVSTGAYEPPKAAKEHATTTYARVPSKCAILSKYERCASIGNGYCHIHTRIAMPSSAFEFVFRWHASYTLLRRLRRLICSWFLWSSQIELLSMAFWVSSTPVPWRAQARRPKQALHVSSIVTTVRTTHIHTH